MAGSKRNLSTIIMVVVILAVLALGVFAVWGTFSDIISTNKSEKATQRIQSGEATVSELANADGMTVEEYLAKFDITDEDQVTKDTNMLDFSQKLTLSKYMEFVGISYTDEDFAAYKAENKIGEDVTADTKDNEVKVGFASYMYQKLQEQQAASNSVQQAETGADAESGAENTAE